MALRYTLINAQYGQPLNFTFESVKDAQKTLDGLQNLIARLKQVKGKDSGAALTEDLAAQSMEGFTKAMDDNLNVPEAMKHVFEFAKEMNKLIDDEELDKQGAEEALEFLEKINSVIGVLDFSEKFFELTSEQAALIKAREAARRAKDWKKSDELRDKLKALGIELTDNKDGSTTSKPVQQN